jgi:hypothetical protein
MALAIPMLFALLAQAEAAPPEPVSPNREALPTQAAVPTLLPEPEMPINRVGLTGGVAYQVTGDIGPKVGYGVGVFLTRRLLAIGSHAQIDVRGQFDYQRFSTTGTAYAEGDRTPYQADRTLSFFQFSALPTFSVNAGPTRPWVGVGGGFVMGHLTTAEEAYSPGESKSTRPIVAAVLGIDLPLRGGAVVSLQIGYDHLVGTPGFTLQNGDNVRPFGSRLSGGLALSYEF